MNNKLFFSSQKLDWRTPDHVLVKLKMEFGFNYFDPCPTNPKFNGLKISWNFTRWNFVNPPYGREIGKWCKKAFEEWNGGKKTVVMLIPSRTDTQWWHDYIMKATEIRFIKGRLKFKGAKNSAPFPSCIVIFKGDKNDV